MKLPEWMKRGPKSNVGVKSLKKSNSVNSYRGSHRHHRQSSTSSSKGKRKRNSYVSSSITTKNFYPVEHFFKSGPDNNGFYNQHANTLPANMNGYNYRNQLYPPKTPDGRLYGNTLATSTYENLKYADLSRPVMNGMQYMQHQQQQHRDFLLNNQNANLEQRRYNDYQQHHVVTGANPISTMTIDRRFTPTFRAANDNHLSTLPRANQAQFGDHWDTWKYNQQRKWSLSDKRSMIGSPPHESLNHMEPGQFSAGAQLSHKQRQIIPTAATGICVSRNDSFRRYKIPSPAAILDMINDKYISSKRKSKSERTSWDYSTVTLSRVPGYGFGIAVSGGRDNPHFANGDPSIAVSDVLKHGPAEGQLQVNDRIISVNGISLENVEYATAVQVLRDSGNTVTLVVKRRVPNHSLMQPTGGNVVPSGVGGNSHQHQHSLSSTGLGLGALGNNGSQQQIKVIVTKASKKDDFGIVLGCRLFIKEISSKTKDQLAANGYSLQEGDLVTRIHNTNCNDSMSLKEAKKIIDGCKERLTLAVLRDSTSATLNAGLGGGTSSGMQSPVYSHTAQVSNCSNMDENYLNGTGGYSGQNLYVQPPTRPSAMSTLLVDDKSNLTPRGRSRGPLTDISLQQLDRPSTPPGATSSRVGEGAASGSGHSRSRSTVDEPPRPPPPRGEDFYSTRRPLHDEKPTSEPRYITFQKEGSVGIRLSGGNEVGIFVTAVQQNSPAAAQGLVPGDKILKVNDMDMNGVTREEAVLYLLSLQDRIDLIVQYCKDEYDNITAQQRGDSFHIKTHFHCENPSKGELSFKAGDVFRVIDTLYNGVVGAWQVLRIGHGHQELQRGVIPNKARAEELATAQFNATKKEMNASESRVSFFRRRRSTHRRSKSLSRENWDDVVFSDSISKFPAYERVVLRHPGFVRPVVLFGPVADIARERLVKDFSDKYTAPLQDDDKGSSKCGGIVRLSNIRDIMDRGKHALLDITPNAVDRLNYAQFYPIVIFLKADTKHSIKQLRHGLPKSQHKSSKKLFEQCQKLERLWSHVFSTTINLNDPDTWYRKLRDSIDQQQSGAVWMSETKPVESLSDDFLFPMTTSRLSYASSPESDLELSPGPSASLSLGNLPQLVKSSSDPSIATNQDNLDRDRELGDGMPPPYTNPYDHSAHPRRMTVDNKYGFSAKGNIGAPLPPEDAIYGSSRPPPPIQHNSSVASHFGPVPDLPPRIDRASKPPNTTTPSTPGSSLPSRNSSTGGTLGRSAQERLFGNKASTDNLDQTADDYATRSQMLGPTPEKRGTITNGLSSLERAQNSSLDRTRSSQPPPPGNPTTPNKANGSYDSVSSYDSYNTSQLTAQNMRLGPNAPDDLKSVPNARNGTGLTPNQSNVSDYNRSAGSNDLLMTPPRGGHIHPDRNNFNGAHDPLTPRNSGERPGGMNIPQRPSNLALESPRKHIIETKTDYGKYRMRQQFKENLFSNKSQPNLHYYSLCCHNRRLIYSKYDTLV
ncbi:tight junction protein ZO-2 isoform X18 [Ochlerotatus camptorhynchus]|uniref:tight junction protein ZO-2 isoform X18 n=1 Tax=Ochlerotatus camptorhynchus TaxID=644619 RepID=UPI0031D18350